MGSRGGVCLRRAGSAEGARKRAWVLAGGLLLLTGCATLRLRGPEARVDAEEMAVYQAVLRALSDQLTTPSIEARTVDLPADFASPAAIDIWLHGGTCLPAGAPAPSIPSRPMKRIPIEAKWPIPTSATGPTTVHFSRVGFDQTRATATVYVGLVCGDLCGWGYLFLLQKHEEVWAVKCDSILWES